MFASASPSRSSFLRFLFVSVISLLALSLSAPIHAAGLRHVAPNGVDAGNDCTHWRQPCATIQHAIYQADPGDTIRVRTGVYTEADILVDKMLTIQGQSANSTIIQAAPTADTAVAPVFKLYHEDHRLAIDVTLKNVTVRHGVAASRYEAGGIYVSPPFHLRLQSATVAHNTGPGVYNHGGQVTLVHSAAIHNSGYGLYSVFNGSDGTLLVDDSVIADNGGGIYQYGSQAEIVDSAIDNNQGYGILNEEFGDVTMRRSSLNGNSEGMVSLYSTIVIEDSHIIENGHHGLGNYRESRVTIRRTIIQGNGGTGVYGDDNWTTLIETCLISQNGRDGIAILDYSDVTLKHSLVSHNQESGILLTVGYANVEDSIIRFNGRSGIGTDLSSYGAGPRWLTVYNSTISQNTTPASGGGIQAADCVDIRNSTISGNRAAGSGGGIYFAEGNYDHCDPRVLNNVTLTANVADDDRDGVGDGGGVFAEVDGLLLSNSILAGNLDRSPKPSASYADCAGPLTSQGYSLYGSLAGCALTGDTTGNIVGAPPLLGPLAANGGFTPSHALLAGSPALDAANPAPPTTAANACELTDQRGLPRYGRCDMGAYEWQGE